MTIGFYVLVNLSDFPSRIDEKNHAHNTHVFSSHKLLLPPYAVLFHNGPSLIR